MGYITFILSAIMLVVSIKKHKNNLLNPVVLFFTLWTGILFLSILNLYDIYRPSAKAYLLILLMLIFFFIGSFINKILPFLKNKTQKLKKQKIQPFYIAIYILVALFLFFTIIDCVIVVQGLLDGVPMWKIRGWRMAPFGTSSNPMLDRRSFIEEIFRSTILTPFEILMPPIAAYTFFNDKNKKRQYTLLISSILMLLTSSFAGGGGRLGFIYFFGTFIISFVLTNKDKILTKETKKKYSKMLLIFMIIGVAIVVLFTSFRTGASFIKQCYTYFALPPTLLSLWLPEIEKFKHTYGLLTTFGIHSYLFRGLDAIGLDFLIPQIYNDTFGYMLEAETIKQVGYGVATAFVTPVYYFYIDGGYFFVCLASLLFGMLITNAYNKILQEINIRSFTFYILIMYGIFLTFIRVQTVIPAYVIAFILAAILLPTENNINFIKNILKRCKVKICKKN